MPVAHCHSGWLSTSAATELPGRESAGWLGGMNGVKFDILT